MTRQVANVFERVRAVAKAPSQEANSDGRPPMSCAAYGCPCAGTLDLGGGFTCRWHAYGSPEKWSEITRELRENSWLIEFIAEMQTHYQRGKGAKELAPMAATFWAVDPAMGPTAGESGNWNWYLWRMREELAHRVGQRKDRPAPRVAQVHDPKIYPKSVMAVSA